MSCRHGHNHPFRTEADIQHSAVLLVNVNHRPIHYGKLGVFQYSEIIEFSARLKEEGKQISMRTSACVVTGTQGGEINGKCPMA